MKKIKYIVGVILKDCYKIRLLFAGIIGILSLLAVLGIFYPVRLMNLQFVSLLQRLIFDFSITALVLFLSVILITIFYGRIYCSLICPLGILQEFIAFLKRKKDTACKNYGFKYLIAGFTFGSLIGGSALIIRYIDPYTIFSSSFGLSIFGIIAAVAVILLLFFKGRFFCTNICPVGAILGIISKYSINKIYIDKEKCVSCGICSVNCPSNCIDGENRIIDNETCVKCLKCISICKGSAIRYGVQPVKFDFSRRKALWGLGALTMLGAGIAAGVNFAKNIAKEVKNIILPPGADDISRMTNKCLNCNLCVSNCPNKILSKADNEFSAVYVDFNRGEGYCKYKCNKCSEVCPSGAIKKISLEEKQKIKIATAEINENCVACRLCISVCPVKAISFKSIQTAEYPYGNSGIAYVDSSKCIGCGRCKSVCSLRAVKMIAPEKQNSV